MWEHYQKTFVRIQFVIFPLTVAVLVLTNGNVKNTLMFFVSMQLFSWLGASWTARLKKALVKTPAELPLRARL